MGVIIDTNEISVSKSINLTNDEKSALKILCKGAAIRFLLTRVFDYLNLIEGAIGLPVFAKGGGLLYLTGPTAGYLYGMTIAAGVIGYLAERNFNDSYIKSLFSLLLATFIIFVFGVGYLGSVIGYEKALAGGLYPFLPSELFKIALAVAIIPSITKIINLLIEHEQYGLFHYADKDILNRFQFAQLIAKVFELNDSMISPSFSSIIVTLAM